MLSRPLQEPMQCHSLSYLDRNALASARVLNIEKDLDLQGSEFSTCISVFFAGYLTVQIPSNLLLTRVRPSIYLVSLVISSCPGESVAPNLLTWSL
jgi:hypothetical protein